MKSLDNELDNKTEKRQSAYLHRSIISPALMRKFIDIKKGFTEGLYQQGL
jgi:hypothetical protein